MLNVESNLFYCVIIAVQAAYVNGFQGSVLFNTMFEEDGDKDRVSLLPDVPEFLQQ